MLKKTNEILLNDDAQRLVKYMVETVVSWGDDTPHDLETIGESVIEWLEMYRLIEHEESDHDYLYNGGEW